MEKHKKINKLKIIIVLAIFIILVYGMYVFGRFIYNSALEAYFSARQFYFTSDILTVGGSQYTYDSWGGIGEYTISFDLYSYNNELSKLDYDLEYTVSCEALSTDKITCSIYGAGGATSADGIIYATTNTSSVTILINPIAQINEGETVKFKVTAKTEEPYEKEISCTYSLYIRLPEGNSYSIEDVAGRDYALLKLVNRSTAATQVTLEFDPSKVRLDLNDEIYTDSNQLVSVATNASGYINKIVFKIPKESAKNVKFYKVDKSQDYTYPGAAASSVIDVDY